MLIELYLPRSWGSKRTKDTAQVMVARPPLQNPEIASHSLMSLLREGGQWDDEDDLRIGRSRGEERPFESGQLNETSPVEEEESVPRIRQVSTSGRYNVMLVLTGSVTRLQLTQRRKEEDESAAAEGAQEQGSGDG